MNFLSHSEKSIIFWIGSFMGNKMIAWPSNEELARVCSVSLKTVQRTIKKLEEKNIITVKREHRKNNVYTFNPNWLAIFDSLNIKLGNVERHGVQVGRHDVKFRETYGRTNNINNNINNNNRSYPQSKEWKGLSETLEKPSSLLEDYMKRQH